MVQVLPPVPTFGSRLAEALSGAAVNYAQGKEKRQSEAKDKAILEQASDENLTPTQRANLYAGLSQKKLQALSPVLSALSKAGVKEQSENKKIELWKEVLGLDKDKSSAPQGTSAPTGNVPQQGGRLPVPGQAPIEGMQNEGEIMQEERPYPQEKVDRAFVADTDLGKFMQSQNEAFDRRQAQNTTQKLNQLKFEETKKHHEAGEKLAVHETSKDFAKGLSEGRKRAQNTLKAIKNVRKALDTHRTGLTWENFFKKQFGGTILENIQLTPEGAIIEASIPAFLEGGRELFGKALTDADLRVILGKTIDLGKPNAANEAILDMAEYSANLLEDKAKIADEIIKENKGYRPIDFEALVEDRFQEKFRDQIQTNFRQKVGPLSTDIQMITPKGDVIWVPPEDVDYVTNELQGKVV